MPNVIININLDAKCKRCGKGGAMQNGFCMPCQGKEIIKRLKRGEFDDILKPLKDKARKDLRKQ